MKNKTKIKIINSYALGNMPLSKILEKLCLLKTARKIGDVEVVNNTQLGRLKDNNIVFEIISDGELTYRFASDFITIEKDGIFLFNIHFGNDCLIKTKEEAEIQAKRIVMSNNMHNELVEHTRKLNDEFVFALTNIAKVLKLNMSVESLRIEENTLVKKSKQLLQQAEQK